jgi:3-phosphoshikimate 1-carboxyvinyltransferase
MKSVRVHPCEQLKGRIIVPGDKSISHRAVMIAALARGPSILQGLLMSEDVLATIGCFRAMGVSISVTAKEVRVEGVGLKGLRAPEGILDCGNSGTTMRLMLGILAGQPFSARLTGDASLNRRPMERVIGPLKQMGAHIEELRASATERVLKITGHPLTGIRYQLPMASAQVKSAILLAGLFASGPTQVIETVPSRDHTERILQKKRLSLKKRGSEITLEPGKEFSGEEQSIPGDISSAAFFLVAGCIAKGGEIQLQGVGINPTRTGILDSLTAMGAQWKKSHETSLGGEPTADLLVQPSTLRGTAIEGEMIPRLIDEIPVLGVAALRAKGLTTVRGAGELRVKESDRIATQEQEFKKLSCNINTLADGWEIQGPQSFHGGSTQSHGDHRIAMSLAIAATQASAPVTIADVDCVHTSYPEFWDHLQELGVRVEFC